MKIAIECSRLSGQKTGIGYYVDNLVRSLEELKPSHEFLYFHSGKNRDPSAVPSERKFVSYAFFKESLAIYCKLNPVLKRHKADLFHATANTGIPPFPACPCVATIHDLFPLEYPGLCPPRMAFWTRHFMKWVKLGATHYMTDSKFTAERLNKILDIPYTKITVVPLGAPAVTEKIKDEKAGYFLQVGAIEPRKGYETMLKAWKSAKPEFKKPFQWIIAGPMRNCPETLYEELKKEARVLEYVSEVTLSDLYQNATAFVMPSFYEGFGLPVLEAMAAGCPVISSDAPALAEISGGASIMFPAGDSRALKKCLVEIHDNPLLQKNYSALGIRNALKYSWEESAKNVLNVYSEIGGGCHG